jgi:phosphatidylglycerophosphatase C
MESAPPCSAAPPSLPQGGSRSAPASPCVALFDLDGTLTWRDTLFPFLLGYALRRPARWLCLWRVPLAFLQFLAAHHDRGKLKSQVIRIVMGGDARAAIDAWADAFVGNLQRRRVFRPAALAVLESHRAAGDRLVLLSASPDLYVPRLGQLLGFERTLCTEIEWQGPAGAERLDGALKTANRRGEEKSRCLDELRLRYPGLPIVAYGNSASDLPHMKLADRALLVNADAGARRAAAELHLPVGDWRD